MFNVIRDIRWPEVLTRVEVDERRILYDIIGYPFEFTLATCPTNILFYSQSRVGPPFSRPQFQPQFVPIIVVIVRPCRRVGLYVENAAETEPATGLPIEPVWRRVHPAFVGFTLIFVGRRRIQYAW
jgi:hypothetical protein